MELVHVHTLLSIVLSSPTCTPSGRNSESMLTHQLRSYRFHFFGIQGDANGLNGF